MTAPTVTVDHTIATIGRLRHAWAWLADSLQPGRTPRVHRHQSEAAQARLHRLGVAERADRTAILKAGAIPTGTTAAAARVATIDARTGIAEHLDDLAWRTASHLRGHVSPYRPHGRDADARAGTALDYLARHVPQLHDANLLGDIHNRLAAADQLARSIVGIGPDLRSLKTECPACGRRSLASDTSSPDYREWAITCTRRECLCRGVECGCNMVRRYPGAHHLWLERYWESLAVLLARRDAA